MKTVLCKFYFKILTHRWISIFGFYFKLFVYILANDWLSCFLQIDRVYVNSSQCVAVLDHERKRTYVMRKDGLPDVGNHGFPFSMKIIDFCFTMLKFRVGVLYDHSITLLLSMILFTNS